MYKAHSKDINRNKSFHPLTFGNLSRVEKLKEKEAAKAAAQAERQQELLRDKEENRYNELLFAGGDGATAAAAAGVLPVKRIFAAEYEKDAEKEQERGRAGPSPATTTTTTAAPDSKCGGKFTGFLSKFTRDADSSIDDGGTAGQKRERDDTGVDGPAPVKSAKTEEDGEGGVGGEKKVGGGASASRQVTGFVTTAEATHLRKEYESLRKQRVDPMRKVQEYQNRTVAAAAAAKQKEEEHRQSKSSGGGGGGSGESAIRERIRKLMELSSKNK